MERVGFQVDTRLAKLLSENYRSSEKAIKELVDNAWDADSESVSISLPEPLTNDPIIIHDNGSGMTKEEIEREYLSIASDRRKRRGELTSKKKRKVKGKKGIGKFAGLMAANVMKLETWARGQKCQFAISTTDLDLCEDIEKLHIDLEVSKCKIQTHGTRITLSSLQQNLAFPNPDKFRQILLQEYGREDDFEIIVNDKKLGVDDIKGTYTNHENDLPTVGKIKLIFTVSNQQGKLKQPGISIRVDGKIVGKPDFFGLDKSDDFPSKLLDKIYGEIEVDGLFDHVTADWGAIVENSEKYQLVKEHVQPIILEKVKEQYGKEIGLAQARLSRKINERLALLPEYKRQYADKAIKGVLGRYYGEPESKVESLVSVLLDALERTEYRAILDYIHEADRSDISKLAEILSEFGLAELIILGEQAQSRLEFLDKLELLCKNPETDEAKIHSALENNPWIFGAEYSVFSSNKTLRRIVEEYLDKNYKGSRASKRPDLMLSVNYSDQYLLIEFKRPHHPLSYSNYQQATAYRNDFRPYIKGKIEVMLIGGKRGKDLPELIDIESNVRILIFDEIISTSRNQINWLLKELGGDAHA